MSFHSAIRTACAVFFISFLGVFHAFQAYGQAEQSVWLSLTDPNDIYNETLISFNKNATDAEDLFYDTHKLTIVAGSDIYSKIDTGDFKAQTLPLLVGDKTVSLGIDAVVAGDYKIRLEILENIDESVVIVLEDTVTGVMQNLRNEPQYIFNSATGVDIRRLKVHFYPPFSFTATNITCAGNPGAIHLSQPGTHGWTYEIMDHNNAVIDSGSMFNGVKTLDYLDEGTYTINLQDSFGYQITKQVVLEGKEPVEAQFEVSEEVLQIGETLHFYDYSIGASSLTWNFGDGTVLTDEAFPTHDFSQPGEYHVILTASNQDCQQTFLKTIQVSDIANGISNTAMDALYFYSYGNELIVGVPNLLETARVEVFNLLGQNIHTEPILTSGEHKISLSGKCDFCVVKISSGNASVTGKVFIRE